MRLASLLGVGLGGSSCCCSGGGGLRNGHDRGNARGPRADSNRLRGEERERQTSRVSFWQQGVELGDVCALELMDTGL